MAFVDDKDKNKDQQALNVFGQQSGQAQPAQPGGQAQTATPQGGASTYIADGAPAPQAGVPQVAAGKPKGSGMFTDVNKYALANKPQAQKISGAVTGKIQQEAGKVQNALSQQSKTFQDRLNEQRNRVSQAQTFAQQQIQAAQNTQAQPAPAQPAPAPAIPTQAVSQLTPVQAPPTQEQMDLDRFRQLATGQQQFNIEDTLNTTDSRIQSQRLARRAALAERAGGTSQFLRDTFGQGQKYTRGQKGLDELVLGAETGERQSIVDTAKKAAQDVQGQLRSAEQEAMVGRTDLMDKNLGLRKNINEELQGARTGLVSEVEAQVAAQRAALKAEQDTFRQAVESGTVNQDLLQKYIDPQGFDEAAKRYEARRQALNMLGRRDTAATGDWQKAFESGDPYMRAALAEFEGSQAGGSGRERLFSMDNGRATLHGGQTDLGSLMRGNELMARTTGGGDQGEIEMGSHAVLENLGVKNTELQQQQAAIRQKYAKELQDINKLPDTVVQQSGKTQSSVPNPERANRLTQLENKMGQEVWQNLINAKMPQQTKDQITADYINRLNQQKSLNAIKDDLSFADEATINEASTITDAQLARQNALSRLAGVEGEGIQRAGSVPTKAAQLKLAQSMKRLGTRGIR